MDSQYYLVLGTEGWCCGSSNTRQILKSHAARHESVREVVHNDCAGSLRTRPRTLPSAKHRIHSTRLARMSSFAAPTLSTSDDGKVLEALLLICYPISIPDSVRSLDEVGDLLRVAIKYEMDLPTTVLEKELMVMARHSPLQVWALGCRMGLEHIARYAARATLHDSTIDLAMLGDMQGITAAEYYRLREFRRLAGQVESDFSLLTPQIPPACAAIPSAIQDIVPENCKPDLICSSSDGVIFRVRESTVKAASSVIEQKVIRARKTEKGRKGKRWRSHASGSTIPLELNTSPDPSHTEPSLVTTPTLYQSSLTPDLPARIKPDIVSSTPNIPSVNKLRTIDVDEHSSVLTTVLKLCTFGSSALPSAPALALAALGAAERLGMDRIKETLRKHWDTLLVKDPVRAYFAVRQAGLTEVAKTVARNVLNGPLDGLYVPEMEDTPALLYHNLVTYYDSCRGAARSLLLEACRHEPSPPIRSCPPVPPSPASDVSSLDMVSSLGTLETLELPNGKTTATDGRTSRDSGIWLEEYIDGLTRTIDSQPRGIPFLPESVFVGACERGQWCSSCDGLAQKLSRVALALREIPSAVERVALEV
ncbi:hypothetical protein C8Q74DRAFT_560773 [Fomes fomentarius]|nr:hypothetical protein C8Q74DRAFT_560773 [Fomes fomentarius]